MFLPFYRTTKENIVFLKTTSNILRSGLKHSMKSFHLLKVDCIIQDVSSSSDEKFC